VRTEGQPDLKPDPHWVNPTYEQSGAVRDYYLNIHGWKSIDNKGMDMHSVDDYDENYDNAFWDDAEMVYGAGDGTTFRKGGFNEITVSGHEMTHGVTAHRSGLVYRDWPGIINEHLSDVGGINVKHYHEKLGPDKADNWLLGAGIFAPGVNGRAIRHMLEPGTAFDDWRLGGKDPQPKSYKDYQQTDSDNGGVHLYSGIPNCAYATFAQEVGLPVYEFAAHVWFKAAGMIGSQASLDDLVQATLQACKSRDNSKYNALVHAWNTVDVKAGSMVRRFWVMSGLYKLAA
jgi:Zn-dependent metalloprotease